MSPVSSPVMRRKRWRASGYLGRGRKRVRASGASIACFQADENSSSGNIRSGQQVAVARSCSASAPESAARIAKNSNAVKRSAAVGMGIIEIPAGREFRRELFGFRADSAIPGLVQAAFLMYCGRFPAPRWAGIFLKSAGNLFQGAGNCLRSHHVRPARQEHVGQAGNLMPPFRASSIRRVRSESFSPSVAVIKSTPAA